MKRNQKRYSSPVDSHVIKTLREENKHLEQMLQKFAALLIVSVILLVTITAYSVYEIFTQAGGK